MEIQVKSLRKDYKLVHYTNQKAAGLDRIKPVILQELSVELAPLIKVLFERSIDSGATYMELIQCLTYIQEGG